MAGPRYDTHQIATWYDDLGEREWSRFELSAIDRVVTAMSLLAAARAFLVGLPGLVERFGWERAVRDVFATSTHIVAVVERN